MTLSDKFKTAQKFAIDNSPSIFTGLGVVGLVSTAFLTGQATFKAAEVISTEEFQLAKSGSNYNLTAKDKAQLTWKFYIPAVGVGVLSCGAIIGANQVSSRRTAAVAAAYSLSEKAFTEYKDKVVEKIGEKKEKVVRDEIAQDRVHANPLSERGVVIIDGKSALCYDTYSGRYFMSDMETLKKAQNDTNYQILSDMYASLSDFYQRVGLSSTAQSEEVGWTTDKQLELEFSGTLSEDQRPCIAVSFRTTPVRNYYKMG